MSDKCKCQFPLEICDNRGCHCTYCGKPIDRSKPAEGTPAPCEDCGKSPCQCWPESEVESAPAPRLSPSDLTQSDAGLYAPAPRSEDFDGEEVGGTLDDLQWDGEEESAESAKGEEREDQGDGVPITVPPKKGIWHKFPSPAVSANTSNEVRYQDHDTFAESADASSEDSLKHDYDGLCFMIAHRVLPEVDGMGAYSALNRIWRQLAAERERAEDSYKSGYKDGKHGALGEEGEKAMNELKARAEAAEEDAREWHSECDHARMELKATKRDAEAAEAECKKWSDAADRAQQPPEFYKEYDEGTMRAMQALLEEEIDRWFAWKKYGNEQLDRAEAAERDRDTIKAQLAAERERRCTGYDYQVTRAEAAEARLVLAIKAARRLPEAEAEVKALREALQEIIYLGMDFRSYRIARAALEGK